MQYEDIDSILDEIKIFNFFKLTNSTNTYQVCGYAIKYMDIQSFPFCQKRGKKRLCLELDPVDNIDLLTFYKQAVGSINLIRQKLNEPLLKVQEPIFEFDDSVIYIKCVDVEVARIQCCQIRLRTNKSYCELKQINIQDVFSTKLIREMYISDGIFKCILNPYLLGKLNEKQFNDLHDIYYILGKKRGQSQFFYCEYDLNFNQYRIGLIDNLTHQSKTIGKINHIMQEKIHRLYREFELKASLGIDGLFNINLHFIN